MDLRAGFRAVVVAVAAGLAVALLFGLLYWGWLSLTERDTAFDRAANLRQVRRDLPVVAVGLVSYLGAAAWASYAPRTKSPFAAMLGLVFVLGWVGTLLIAWSFLPKQDKSVPEGRDDWLYLLTAPIAPVAIGLAVSLVRALARPRKSVFVEL